MKCEDSRAKLTAYLDGELDGDRGSALRGHLRGCEACRQAAADEAVLRDGLRALPPLDPPASLWAGVQAKLAAAEVADAERSPWRRLLARWVMPQQLALAGVGIVALVTLLVWKSHRADDKPTAVADQHVVIAPEHDIHAPEVHAPTPAPKAEEPDVTAELAASAARATGDYAAAAAELAKLAQEARAGWSDERRREFDAHLSELRARLDGAAEGRPRQQAYRALIRYLQNAVVREQVSV